MKKTISLLLVLVLMLAVAMPVFATEITTDATGSNAGETVVTYGFSQSFLVVIPADFEISSSTKMATADIKASDVVLAYGKTLNVKISGHDYDDAWELIDVASADNKLEYTIGTSEGANDIVNNSVVLSVAAGDNWDSEVVETMYFKVIDNNTTAGQYSDTLTFTVSVD